MKKAYNVYSTKMTLKSYKALSVSFIFALFFLGMSSNVNAQLATSRADVGNAVDADYSITQKANVSLTDEAAMTILEAELQNSRLGARDATDQVEEARFSARTTFLDKTIMEMTFRDATINEALFRGHAAMAMQISRYSDSTQVRVKADDIAKDVVERLK